MIRKATEKDLDRIAEIYDEVLTAEEAGTVTTGWIRGIYPTRCVAENALARGTLYVLEDGGTVVATAKIDREQVEEYRNVNWQYPADESQVLVLHTLIVSPSAPKKGYGTQMIKFYEQTAKEQGFRVLRMDTNKKNTVARSLYQKLGYRESGALPCDFNGIPNVIMICLEKPVL